MIKHKYFQYEKRMILTALRAEFFNNSLSLSAYHVKKVAAQSMINFCPSSLKPWRRRIEEFMLIYPPACAPRRARWRFSGEEARSELKKKQFNEIKNVDGFAAEFILLSQASKLNFPPLIVLGGKAIRFRFLISAASAISPPRHLHLKKK
jgi:hypothetical protein